MEAGNPIHFSSHTDLTSQGETRMKNRARLVLTLAFFLSTSPAFAQPVDVSLPADTTASRGASIAIPITVNDVTGRRIVAYQATVAFDNHVLRATGVTSAGTLTRSFNAPVVEIDTTGRILVGASGADPLQGRGTLVFLNFDVIGAPGQFSDLLFDFFLFNIGIPAATTSNGRFTVSTPARPEISVRPAEHDFGEITVGDTARQAFRIANIGNATLHIAGIGVTGPDSNAFSAEFPALPFSLQPAGSLSVAVSFAPQAVGSMQAFLRVRSDAAANPEVAVPLLGAGIPAPEPDIRLSRPELAFGEVPLDSFAVLPLTLANLGDADLIVQDVSVAGARDSNFLVRGKNPPFAIAASDSQMLQVSFRPFAVGPEEANLSIASNDPDEPSLSVRLTGTGTSVGAPTLKVQPEAFDFGIVEIGDRRRTAFQFTNPGTAPLRLDSLRVTGSGAAQFSLDLSTLAGTIVPGDTQSVRVTFAPVTAGVHSATLAIASNDSSTRHLEIPLSGRAVAALTAAVSIASPENGEIVCEDSVVVRLLLQIVDSIEPSTAACTVNGLPAADSSGIFIARLPVRPGSNRFLAMCAVRDSLGRTAIVRDSVSVSQPVPLRYTTKILQPAGGAIVTTDDSITVRVRHTGNSAAVQQACSVNGRPALPVEDFFQARLFCPQGNFIIAATCTAVDSCDRETISTDTTRIECQRPAADTSVLIGVEEKRSALVYVTVNAPQPQLTLGSPIFYAGRKIPEIQGAALDPVRGRFLMTSTAAGGQLFELDVARIPRQPSRQKAKAWLIGPTGLENIEALAVQENTGELFGVDRRLAKLVRLDRKTGKATRIGRTGFTHVESLAFSNDDPPILYAVDNDTRQLLIIDTETGHGTAITGNETGLRDIETLAFSPGGRLFGFNDDSKDSFVSIDLQTGRGAELTAIDADGLRVKGMAFFDFARISTLVTSEETPSPQTPAYFALEQNYPNPFNPTTIIRYEIPRAGNVSLKIFNVLGHSVKTLVDGQKPAGRYTVTWDGADNAGRVVSNGAYFYRLTGNDFVAVKKMLLLR